MSNTKTVMSQASNQYVAPTMIEDVFSTYLYTGNGSTQTITNGIDLAGEGGLVWIKDRDQANNHVVFDTERGANNYLYPNETTAQGSLSGINWAFNSDGFSQNNNYNTLNQSGIDYASWTFRKAPRFFDVVTYTGNDTGQSIPHNLGVAPGCILIKEIDGVSNWGVYHRGIGATKFLNLNATDAATTFSNVWNDTEPTDAVFTVGNETAFVNNSNHTYVAYLFAHDPLGPSGDGSDGLIACGEFTVSGTASVDLGWEPQWLLVKQVDSTGSWNIVDSMRGFNMEADSILYPNSSSAELSGDLYDPTPTGFNVVGLGSGTYIYIAIRRGPMRVPTSGTEVFAIDTLGGTAPNPPGFDAGFPVDLGFYKTAASSNNWVWADRLRGEKELFSNLTNAEASNTDIKFDYQSGWLNSTGVVSTLYSWMFRRAPGFFDVVAYSGTGTERQVPHGLGVTPEMLIIKRRDGTNEWFVHHTGLTSWAKVLQLQSTGAETNGDTGGNLPTETGFPVNASANVNGTGANYIAYLFATLPGVSKVGSYTGDGTTDGSKVIDCGFTSGARFVLIKRTDLAGDWYVWDTARGIVSGNDPRLKLNSTDEEASFDNVDPNSSGFSVTGSGINNINGASYIFYAIA